MTLHLRLAAILLVLLTGIAPLAADERPWENPGLDRDEIILRQEPMATHGRGQDHLRISPRRQPLNG